MDDPELRKLLEQLQAEIANTQTTDEKGRELLRHLEGDILGYLGQPDATGMPPRPAAIQRLEDGLQHFETTHPDLTNLLARLLEALSNAGI